MCDENLGIPEDKGWNILRLTYASDLSQNLEIGKSENRIFRS